MKKHARCAQLGVYIAPVLSGLTAFFCLDTFVVMRDLRLYNKDSMISLGYQHVFDIFPQHSVVSGICAAILGVYHGKILKKGTQSDHLYILQISIFFGFLAVWAIARAFGWALCPLAEDHPLSTEDWVCQIIFTCLFVFLVSRKMITRANQATEP